MTQWFLAITLAFFSAEQDEFLYDTVLEMIPTQSEQHCRVLERAVYEGGYILWNAQVDNNGVITQNTLRGKHNGIDFHFTGACELHTEVDGRWKNLNPFIEQPTIQRD